MRDDDDLLEAVAEAAQQLDDVLPPRFIERPEDFVENEERQFLSRALGDHLRDREAEDEIGEIFFAAGDDGLGDSLLEHRQAVLIVELQFGIARVGELDEK